MKWIVVYFDGSDLRAVSYVYNDYATAMMQTDYLLKQGLEHVCTIPFDWPVKDSARDFEAKAGFVRGVGFVPKNI